MAELEFLDRSRAQTVADLKVRSSGQRITVRARPRPKADARVEVWEAQRNAGLFEQAFHCKVTIQ